MRGELRQSAAMLYRILPGFISAMKSVIRTINEKQSRMLITEYRQRWGETS
jgi:hypothetical protein